MDDVAGIIADLKEIEDSNSDLVSLERETIAKAIALIKNQAAENAAVEEGWNEIDGFMNRIDSTISESLEKIGEFPGKPAGFPDRVDAACRLLESIPELKTELERLTKSPAEPIACPDCKGCAAVAEDAKSRTLAVGCRQAFFKRDEADAECKDRPSIVLAGTRDQAVEAWNRWAAKHIFLE